MNKLQQAIKAGEIEAEKRLQDAKNEQAADLIFRKDYFEKQVKCSYDKLTKDDWLFKEIKQAVIDGKKSICLNYYGIETIEAIKRHPKVFAGIHARHESGYCHINSDDMREDWEHVIITWDNK